MPKFHSLKDAEVELAKYVPLVKRITGKQITLQRTKPLMKALGNPEQKLKIIHVAGTSGKTSTSYYLAAMLQSMGQKVGLTVSPHLDRVTERLQINGKPVSDAEFCGVLAKFIDLITNAKLQPTYFELLTALAYWYFEAQEVDYAVVETGMGGLHDATNIAQAPDKICVITDIGYDHMHILGAQIDEIAKQKAGIIHAGNQAYMCEQAPEIMMVIREHCKMVGAHLKVLKEVDLKQSYNSAGLDGLPAFQQRNWLLARHVLGGVAEQNQIILNQGAINKTVAINIPGRMEEFTIDDKTIVMDGAHNKQKMTAFVEGFKSKYPNRKADIVLALKEGKEYKDVLPLLVPICRRLIITTFDVMQDLQSKSIDPSILAKEAKALGISDVTIEADTDKAWHLALSGPSHIVVATGSFYLLSLVRKLML